MRFMNLNIGEEDENYEKIQLMRMQCMKYLYGNKVLSIIFPLSFLKIIDHISSVN